MSIITKLSYWLPGDKNQGEGYWFVQIDGKDCMDGEKKFKIRERTFDAVGIKVGDHITLEELRAREDFAFKRAYSKTWAREAERIEAFKRFIETKFPAQLEIKETGLGTGTQEMIERHAMISEKIDLKILKREHSTPSVGVELTGTDLAGLTEYWIRPDKISHIQKHQSEVIWVVLMYLDKNIYIMPDAKKVYPHEKREIRGITEHYVVFKDNHFEVRSESEFVSLLKGNLHLE